jgi:hypothetical protein
MSEENVELHRRMVEAFNARDLESYIAYFDPSIELHSAFAAVGGAIYHGHDGLRKWHRDLSDVWGDEVRAEARPISTSGTTRSSSTCCTAAENTAERKSRCRTPWRLDGVMA